MTEAGPRVVPAGFVRAHTQVRRPSLVPEVRLHVADDVVALWEAMEVAAGGAGEAPPFWAAAWPGGQALARAVLDGAVPVGGRRVLDLGSGSGLVAIAAVLAGARHVLASDVDPFSRTAVGVNAGLNGVTGISVTGDVLDREPPAVDVVLAGDVCYDREMTERVLPFLDRARARGCEVLVGDPGRPYLPHERLEPVLALDVPETEGPGLRRTTVWRLP
ncbi:class I SAM-dependent methyltransferase [Geodermatophilus nigrescens]|uniref:Predicted nicotinamide N-methyase n=1 Tax=Geodermatophilus nigrescens TaxID=1070870 RepID=A0A1M5IV20_9ACTN|nr:50S ribosomal protein L11 methyltransferase [Geodermatophilus nigrescens]SHG32111.1 Predicted nicotinamide N-methyase [Geodermatophilus nigrescens]